MDEALGKADVVTSILGAIDEGEIEDACKSATNWCDLTSDHRNACEGNPLAWKTLTDRIFPNTTRLRELLARVPNSDSRKVFVGLCNTKPILRVFYAQHVYFQLDRHLSFVSKYSYVGEDERRSAKERLRIFNAFESDADAWWRSARRNLSDLQWGDDQSMRPYRLVLDDVESPLWRIRNLVYTYSSDAIDRAVDYGRPLTRQDAEKFVFDVSIEDKKKAIEALIDTCVEAALDLLEQGHDLSPGDRPPELVDPLKEKLRAPFANAIEQV